MSGLARRRSDGAIQLTIAQVGLKIVFGEAIRHGESQVMSPTQGLIDNIYRERVLRARRTPVEQKVLAGAELFESACQMTCAGIRLENPAADEARVQALLRDRLALARRLGS